MESYKFRYVSIAHSGAGDGLVGLNLEGEGGSHFVALLSVEDAKRLLDDLPLQVHIASPQPV